MGHASANLAAVELRQLRASRIRVGQSRWNNHILRRVVGPKRAVAPAHGAVAIRHLSRSVSNRKADCSANTGRLDQRLLLSQLTLTLCSDGRRHAVESDLLEFERAFHR